jgi:hypothetical protein
LIKPRVYIAGPITKGNLAQNVRQATEAFWTLLRAGFAPFCPHWSCYSGGPLGDGDKAVAIAERLPNGSTHADWIGLDLPWVEVSNAVLRLPGESVGADAEVKRAHELGIPVFDSIASVVFHFALDTNHPEKR